MFIVTTEFNDYDQHGEYFVAAYNEKPTFKQLKELIGERDIIVGKLTKGGGRHGIEDQWYNLHEVKNGKKLFEE